MSNLPAAFNGTKLAPSFVGAPKGDELTAGITGGFGIMSYRGKVWSTKYQGVERPLVREDGDGPRASIEIVIVKAATPIAKIFYESGYIDGSSSPPDCWSTNGQTPDAAAPKKQSPTCAGCPKNAWGSKVTDAGKQAKACADSKRLAIVPVADIDNEAMGGPMLLRVPAASLKELKNFGEQMQAAGYPYYAIATRISFDMAEAYPKFVFNAMRPLTEQEAQKVLALREDPRIGRILNEAVENVHHEPDAVQPAKSPFESGDPAKPVPQAPSAAQPASSPAPAPAPAQAQPKAEAKPKPAPAKKSKAELLREQLAAAEAEEAQAKVAQAAAEVSPPAEAKPNGTSPAPAEFEKMLDDLLPQ